MIRIEAVLPRGACPTFLFGADEPSDAPVVLMFPDAFGPRPASFAVAERFADEGRRVLMIDNLYEHAPYEPITPTSIFEGGPDRDRLTAMLGTLGQAKIDADAAEVIAFASARLGTRAPLAAIGYCMGGRHALTAAGASDRVRYAASIHGGGLAPADGDGPHRRAASAAGRIHVVVAAIDPTYDAAEHGRLAAALRDTDHVLETYHGAAHGFAFADLPVHDAAAAERHFRRLGDDMRTLLAA